MKHGAESNVYKILKQVYLDINLLKRAYSSILLFTHSLKKRAAYTLAEGAAYVVHFNNIRRAGNDDACNNI